MCLPRLSERPERTDVDGQHDTAWRIGGSRQQFLIAHREASDLDCERSRLSVHYRSGTLAVTRHVQRRKDRRMYSQLAHDEPVE